MNEFLFNAAQELKRADHSIFVSLKYTRTGDLLKGIVERLINASDFLMFALLEKAKEDKKITEVPTLPGQKCELLRTLYPQDEKIQHYVTFYMLLRKISRADTQSEKEFRRHVTMIADIEDGMVEINIDIINQYFERVKEFFTFVREQLGEEHITI